MQPLYGCWYGPVDTQKSTAYYHYTETQCGHHEEIKLKRIRWHALMRFVDSQTNYDCRSKCSQFVKIENNLVIWFSLSAQAVSRNHDNDK